MGQKDEKVRKLLNSLRPEQRAFFESLATTRAQNHIYEQQLKEIKEAYDDLWKVVIVILHAQPENTLRIHESQFLRFKHEYRIDKQLDVATKEVVLKLLTLHDELPSKKH